jgi:hypothetical protein
VGQGRRAGPSRRVDDPAGGQPSPVEDLRHEARRIGPGLPARRVIDPTGGSGTTALTCSFLGIDCDTVEVNPFLADVIEAKTRSYVTSELSEDMALVLGSPSTAPLSRRPTDRQRRARSAFGAPRPAGICPPR